MGVYSVKPRFQQALRGVELFLVRQRVHPDYLTLAALVLSLLGGMALIGSGRTPWLLLVVPPIVLVRTALNALDGLVARDTGLARPWGEVLNEFCDRLSDVALFAGAAVAPGSDPALGAAVLVMMLLSSYLGTAAKAAGGKRQYGGVMGKADRMLLLAAGCMAAYLWPSLPVFRYLLVLVAAGLALTIVQRLRASYADLQSLR